MKELAKFGRREGTQGLANMACAALALLALANVALADDSKLLDVLQTSMPHVTVLSVRESNVTGIREIEVAEHSSFMYVTADGAHLIAGDLYSIDGAGLINLSEARREEKRRVVLSNLASDSTIAFGPTTEVKAIIYVFTDVDCPYSRQFHANMDVMNAFGIEIHYLAYPRAGLESDTYKRMESAWCSVDPHRAFVDISSGESIPIVKCDSPVADHLALGRSLGVEGTPTIVTEDGRRISGYVRAKDLAEMLDLNGA